METQPFMNTVTFQIERFATPTGRMALISDAQGRVHALDWEDHDERMQRLLGRYYRNVTLSVRDATKESAARRALLAYFKGQLDALADIKVATSGTEFQNQVWSALRRIPLGQTLSYGALAKKIGRPAAVRAVGLANGANPIAIVVPCHRVIGANASLTGYGGGLERKRWLLEHEASAASRK
ncbi:MAG TPA: methylated-DNA--[protein]-cysteine S-methyltransferase [Polyangiaceae bacterium]|jgi:methylated-DNA-[protein]-cysteine S-methyltransferase|nr:methylated-DNA--[protein]-cysteine S-methyltransferase [Polyangiaceae bacterium]